MYNRLYNIHKNVSDYLHIYGDRIIIDNKQYSEIIDYNLEFNFYSSSIDSNSLHKSPNCIDINLNNINNILDTEIPYQHIEDNIERSMILENAGIILSEMDIDLNSRRCVLQPKNFSNKAACPSFIQFLYRDEIAFIFVKYRSQNITNFTYDIQTNIMLVELLKNKILNLNKTVKNIILRIGIVSLHKNL